MAKTSSVNWHETWQAYAAQAVLGLLLAYVFVSLAINSGSIFQYFVAILLFSLSLRATITAVKRFRHGNNKH